MNVTVETHPFLNGRLTCYLNCCLRTHGAIYTGIRRDAHGNVLVDGAPPPPMPPRQPNNFAPYISQAHFEIADFLYRDVKMSGGHMDTLMQLWAAYGAQAPFADHADLYRSIDAITLGGVAWQAFIVTYVGPRPEGEVPSWMEKEYTVWFRRPREVIHEQLGNRDFNGEMDHAPKKVYHGNNRVFSDFMTGEWAWTQAVRNVIDITSIPIC